MAAEPVASDVALRSLARELLDDRIVRIDIFYMYYESETRINITPQLLEAQADMKFTLEPSSPVGQSLVSVIEKLKLHNVEYPADLRWGLVFWDRLGKRAHSIYLGRPYINLGTSRRGYLDGAIVGFDGSLARWLERNYLKQ